MNILVAGEESHCSFYASLFSENGYTAVLYGSVAPGEEKKAGCEYCVLFAQSDIMITENIVKEIKERFEKIKILPVLGKTSYIILETMYMLDLYKICFEFKPEQVLQELQEFIERSKHAETAKEERYIINFYENQNVFFIDITGTLKKQNLMALKLMFKNYLNGKENKLRGIVYIFNNTDEHSSNFQTTWTLFRFWENIGIDFHKVYYLSLSDRITKNVHKYVEPLGVTHLPDMLEVVRALFPEHKNMDEEKLFNFASSLLNGALNSK